MKSRFWTFLILRTLPIILLLPSFALAWCDNCGSGGCCPCPGEAQCLGSYASCDEACGGGGGGGGQDNQWAIQQQQRAAAQAAAQATAAAAARQAELKRQQEEAAAAEAARQAQFIQDRDNAAATLKGPLGTYVTFNTPEAPELKGDVTDTGIKDIKPDNSLRDLGGRHAAWKQLHCAAAITSDALTALQSSLDDPNHDMSDFKYLSGEALNALNGGELGVECPPAPAYPSHEGKTVNVDQGKAVTEKVLERAIKIADRIEGQAASPSPAVAPGNSNTSGGDDELARLRAMQAALNQNQQRKYDPTSEDAIRREQKEKQEVAQLILDTKKVETGDFSIYLGDTSTGGKP